MKLYKSPGSEDLKVLKKYAKNFEKIKISEPALYAGNTYREVIFYKKFVGGIEMGSNFYLYLDSDNNLVEDKITLARLGRLFFFMDAYLNDDEGSIIAALQNSDDVAKEKDDQELIGKALEMMQKKGSKYDISSKDIEDAKRIMAKIIEMRKVTNSKLEKFISTVDEKMKDKKYFDESVIDECMTEYQSVMLSNYEKVKVIASGSDFYVKMKKAAEKIRRKNNLLFMTGSTDALMRLSYVMGYYSNLITSNQVILKMAPNQYLKNIAAAGKINAEHKIENLRK